MKLPRFIFFLVLGTVSCPAASALDAAREVARTVGEAGLRDTLEQEVAVALAQQGATPAALELGRHLSPFQQASTLLAVAAQLPPASIAQAEQLLLDAQTDRVLVHDWYKTRLSRLLAVTHAKMGHFETAEALAREIPDIEDRAFALADIVGEIARKGDVAKARELAGSIEENRRYGTYRQKSVALAGVARILHQRGDSDGAATLLAQAELLLPKKPGWSDGEALLRVGLAAHACGQPEHGRELLARSEALARAISGAWKASELARVADAWRACGDLNRASALLKETADFLATLPPLERAPEALALARARAAAGFSEAANALLTATLADAERAENTDPWRAIRVRTLLARVEIRDADPRPKPDQK